MFLVIFCVEKSNILPHIQINISTFLEDNKFCKKQDISNTKNYKKYLVFLKNWLTKI